MADENKPVEPSAPPTGANPAATPQATTTPAARPAPAPGAAPAAAAHAAKPAAPRPPAAPVPDMAGKTLYVWPDSLIAPISFSQVALAQQGRDPGVSAEFWKDPDARIFQFLGQDNVFFYTLMQGALWLGTQDDPQHLPQLGEQLHSGAVEWVVLAYTLSGLCAGIAALLLVARLTTATESLGNGLELTAIAGAVIGGVSVRGGSGSLWGPVLGTFLLGVVLLGLTLYGVSQFVQQILTGAVLLGAVAHARWTVRRHAAHTTP